MLEHLRRQPSVMILVMMKSVAVAACMTHQWQLVTYLSRARHIHDDDDDDDDEL